MKIFFFSAKVNYDTRTEVVFHKFNDKRKKSELFSIQCKFDIHFIKFIKLVTFMENNLPMATIRISGIVIIISL